MYYVLQENLFREYGFKMLLEQMERGNIPYEIVKYVPFSNELNVKTDRKDVFFFGSINGGKVAMKYGWNPGHFINENFTFEVYLEKYHEHLLNSDGIIDLVKDISLSIYENPFFCRPLTDTKEFTGDLFSAAEWEDYIKDNSEIEGMKVFAASPKTIQQEIRCWIVDNKLVTSSQYKIGNRVNYLNMDNNEEVNIFVKQMIKLFTPARAFVMDICLHNDDYKIVELGCINHCGFYDADMSKLLQALEAMKF